MVKQLDFFTLESISKKEELRKKLRHYQIDKKIKEKYQGKSVNIKTLKEYMNSLEGYEDYYNDLLIELKKIVPVVTFEDYIIGLDHNSLVKCENHYKYYVIYSNSNTKAISSCGPLMYLDDLDDDFFRNN